LTILFSVQIFDSSVNERELTNKT